MNQYLCLLRARPTFLDDRTPQEAEIVGDHFIYLSDLTRRGVVMLAGRTVDAPPVGIVILRADTDADALALMQADPAVASGVFTLELRPFLIALADVAPQRPAP